MAGEITRAEPLGTRRKVYMVMHATWAYVLGTFVEHKRDTERALWFGTTMVVHKH